MLKYKTWKRKGLEEKGNHGIASGHFYLPSDSFFVIVRTLIPYE
jgi:hypothetical protein